MTAHDPFIQIADRVVPGGRLIRRWKLEGGISAEIDAMEIERPSGGIERLVVRCHSAPDRKPLGYDQIATEFAVFHALHAAGFKVPEPRLLDTSGTILPAPYMVMAFVEGSTTVEPSTLSHALREMAGFLARLHTIDPATVTLPPLPDRRDPWAITSRYLPEADLGNRIREAHERHGSLAHRNPPALLHGDFWPRNVIWHDGRIAAVIDWEDVAIGDPAADLAGSRLELLWEYGPEAMEPYTAHYLATMPIDLQTLPFWEIACATAASALMGEWGLEQQEEAVMRERASWLIEDALRRIGQT